MASVAIHMPVIPDYSALDRPSQESSETSNPSRTLGTRWLPFLRQRNVAVLALFVGIVIGALGFMKAFSPVVFLKRDEQLLLEGLSDRYVKNGPGLVSYVPFLTRATKRNAQLLKELSYLTITDSLTGVRRVEVGPKLLFLEAYDTLGDEQKAVVLEKDEYLKILDSKSGDRRVVTGPTMVVPSPTESVSEIMKGVSLKRHEYVRLTDRATGVVRVERGEKLIFPQPQEEMEGKLSAFRLEKHQYIKLLDTATGVVRVEIGEKLVFPTAFEDVDNAAVMDGVSLERQEYVRLKDSATGAVRVEVGEKLVFPKPKEVFERKRKAFQLQKNQYVKLFDTATGMMRVETGEKIVFPTATEDENTGVKNAVNLDHETAALVVSKESGQQRLVTMQDNVGPFFPGQYDEILEERKIIRVEPHEVAIVQDNKGVFHFQNGSLGGMGTAFFLPPHHTLVTMYWGSGTSKEDLENNIVRNAKTVAFKVPVTKIETRAQYAFFEYNVRTADNVELILEGTIFWQVVNVPKMIETTGDPKGDVWYHARSALIQAVSRVTFESFMNGFNDIVSAATNTDQEFYDERGVHLHNLEVTRYECVDAKTSSVLQDIIQETTNRINRLQKQTSENEVQKAKTMGEIETERQLADLIRARNDNEKAKAITAGEAAGLRLANSASTFLTLLNASIPDSAERLRLYRFFEEQRSANANTANLASGKANLFVTPRDVNLRLQMAQPGADESVNE